MVLEGCFDYVTLIVSATDVVFFMYGFVGIIVVFSDGSTAFGTGQ